MDNEARTYKVRPVRPLPDGTALELALHNGEKDYHVTMAMDGSVGCSCMGFNSQSHCKHVDSLTALGILNPAPLMEVRKLYLELIQEREDIQTLRSHFTNQRPVDSCYGSAPPEPVLQADPPPKPRRVRKPRTRKPKDETTPQAA
jgi:hypothetical protein